MLHIAANHLIPTTYGLQYNCGKFNLEYVSTAYLSNTRKSASFSSIVELNISLSTQVLIRV